MELKKILIILLGLILAISCIEQYQFIYAYDYDVIAPTFGLLLSFQEQIIGRKISSLSEEEIKILSKYYYITMIDGEYCLKARWSVEEINVDLTSENGIIVLASFEFKEFMYVELVLKRAMFGPCMFLWYM